MDARRLAARDRGAFAAPDRSRFELALGVGRTLFRDADLDRHVIGAAEPDATALHAGRWIDQIDARFLELLPEAGHILLEHAEGEIVELLARALADDAPAMRMAESVEFEPLRRLAHIESEPGMEKFRFLDIRHGECEMAERMHAQYPFGVAARGLVHLIRSHDPLA